MSDIKRMDRREFVKLLPSTLRERRPLPAHAVRAIRERGGRLFY